MTNPLIRPVANDVSRRTFFRVAGLSVAAIGGSSLLAACSTESPAVTPTAPATSGGTPNYGKITLQLSWVKNIEFAGEYYADSKGYYKQAGFSEVELISGPTDTEAAIVAGKVDIGLAAPNSTATLISEQGAPLKIIGSTFQKNPFCIVSLEEGKPIRTLADLRGKKIGVQAGPNQTIFNGFLKANNINPADLTLVPVGFDITELLENAVDGHMSYITNEPILAKSKGKTPVTLSFADNGLPLTAETFTVTDDTIKNKRPMLKAFLWAEIKGWKDAVADPAGSAKLAVETYGKDVVPKLDVTEQTEEAIAQNGLIVTEDTKKNGLFTLTDALIADIMKALVAVGIPDLTAADLFDLSLLKEVYAEHPELLA
jgi:ABC-type nitrate/sulfonate/bicarbonate transport system substrate-binding protein